MKKELNLGKAGMLLDKLIQDTENNEIRWHKIAMVDITGADKKKQDNKRGQNNYFTADINDMLTANIENYDGNVRIWMEREGERIYIPDEFYKDPSIAEQVNKLSALVKFYSNIQILKEIDEYIGVRVDEKAYLIDDDEDED